MSDRRTMRRYLGEALRQARLAGGVRVVNVAAEAGVAEVTIRRLENGETWPRNIEVVVQAYGHLLGTSSVALWQAAVVIGVARAEYQPAVGRLASVVTGSVDDPRWVAVSPGLSQLLGWAADDLVGESPLEVVEDDRRQRPLRQRMIERRSGLDGAVAILRTRDGEQVPVVYSTIALNGGQLWVATAQLVIPAGVRGPVDGRRRRG